MIPEPLVVLELANNHMGDLDHGLRVISEFGAVCRQYPDFKFAFKLQYRDLDSFIHPDMKGRDDVKYIKRFSETRLSEGDFGTLVQRIRQEGFLAMSTPFDNVSIALIQQQKLDILKIASCSFTDWPLLEDAVATDFPIIASTAGADLVDIDRVISFLSHRQKTFAIMHCVGEYPTADDKMHVSQIEFLRQRYPGVRIGFSTHENPAKAPSDGPNQIPLARLPSVLRQLLAIRHAL
jgi:sialic acid synthase SpsE